MWITQLSHWQTALDAQDKADGGGPVTTFGSFNTRMICRKLLNLGAAHTRSRIGRVRTGVYSRTVAVRRLERLGTQENSALGDCRCVEYGETSAGLG
jgi:hypothetical protein